MYLKMLYKKTNPYLILYIKQKQETDMYSILTKTKLKEKLLFKRDD